MKKFRNVAIVIVGLFITMLFAQPLLAGSAAEYRTAAEQGDAKAQYNLGMCYYNGEGVVKDQTEAVKWWRKAAEQGHAKAQSTLGVYYSDANPVEAAKWFRKAAEQGDAQAQYFLGACYDFGNGVAQDKAEATKWLRKSAAQGYKYAQEALEKR